MLVSRIATYLCCLIAGSAAIAQEDGFITLFDGETLSGWEGNKQMFRVENRAIVAGMTDSPIELTEFLCTTEEYADFELRLEARLAGGRNAGVAFRAQRVADSTEVGGYQADMGFIPGEILPLLSDVDDIETDGLYPLWGSLLDEFRPEPWRYPDPSSPFWLLAVADRQIVEDALNPDGWNSVTIRAVGASISIRLNGKQTVDYVEEKSVPAAGLICLQVHSGEPSLAMYRNISLRTITR